MAATETTAELCARLRQIADDGDLSSAEVNTIYRAIAAITKPAPVPTSGSEAGGEPRVSLKVMKLSDDRADYFVSIQRNGREVTPHVFREEYKAAYHVALYRWLLCGGDEPDLVAFGPDDWPAVASTPAPSPAGGVREAVERILGLDFDVNRYFFTDDEWEAGMVKLLAALSLAPAAREG